MPIDFERKVWDKIAEFNEWNAKVEQLKTLHEQKKQEINKDIERLQEERGKSRVLLDAIRVERERLETPTFKTHRELERSIADINEQIIEQQGELEKVSEILKERRRQEKDAQRTLTALQGDIKVEEAALNGLRETRKGTQREIEAQEERVAALRREEEALKAELARVSVELAALNAKKDELDIYYRRIKAYYEQVGIPFPANVGI